MGTVNDDDDFILFYSMWQHRLQTYQPTSRVSHGYCRMDWSSYCYVYASMYDTAVVIVLVALLTYEATTPAVLVPLSSSGCRMQLYRR